MLSGVYLIVGFYTVSFYQADVLNSSTVEAVANNVQAEQLARSGVSLAMAAMADDGAMTSFAEQSVNASNGTIEYKAEALTATTSKITSTGTFNGKTVTVTAVFNYNDGRWRYQQVYLSPIS